MLHIHTPFYRLEFLDPNGDAEYQGTRYVRGAYLWQAYDRQNRALFTGPLYPDPVPDVFDGQGAPEAFREVDLHGERPLNPVGADLFVPGVGLLAATSNYRIFNLLDAPQWKHHLGENHCHMSCTHGVEDLAYHLEREWTAQGPNLVSTTRIRNSGRHPLRLQWFAHPFFPPMRDGLRLDPGPAIHLPEKSRAYTLDAEGRIDYRRPPVGTPKQRFQLLRLDAPVTCDLSLAHPVCGRVELRGDFPLSDLPIWSNPNTFSPEPYLDLVLEPGDSREWSLRYLFVS
jgi:hypothetical protein